MLTYDNLRAIAVVLNNESITYGELKNRVNLKKNSLSKKIIWLKGKRCLDFIITFLAGLEGSMPMVVYSEQTTEDELKYYKTLIDENGLHSKCQLVLFTSGSSGQPKAVQLSRENIEYNTKAVIEYLNFKNIESQVLFLPMSYSFGLLGQLLPALVLGKTTYLVDHLAKVKACIEKYNPQMISGVPGHHLAFLKLLESKNSHITHVVSAGAPLGISLREQLVNFYSKAIIYNNYGQTELSPRALVLSSSDPSFITGGVGRVVPGLEAKLTDEGELMFQGKQVMLGYVGGSEHKIKDGWLYTGDMASIKDGVFYINGRKDDLVKIGGERISLGYVESLIEKYSNVTKAIVLCKEDSIYGNQLVCIFEGSINESELKELVIHNISKKLWPQKIIKIDKIPLNQNGKIDRKSKVIEELSSPPYTQ